ncbi:unnamed protein product [Prorocentrum cordatum]|uniref:Uncharacterized protein n=1 Tax=Prorocentrum cordatum TaxID=2364126 RepID=A0ABN9PTA3_9DINO|nr:unnamed protein product [Polarella glacialis]
MSLCAWLASEAVQGATQAALLWAARAECPPCSCAPSLVCGSGQETLELVCPPQQAGWPLSAVALALLGGLACGWGIARLAAAHWSAMAAAAAAGHPLAQAALDEGDFVLVLYRVGGARIWHERLIVVLQPTALFGTGILTPDGHAYVEAIAPNSADVRDYAIPDGGAVGGVPPQTGADQVYRFRGLPLPGEVAAASASTRTALGLPPGPPIALNTAGRVIVPVGPAAGRAAAAAPAPAPAAPAAGAVGGLAGLAAALGGVPGGGAAGGGVLVPAAAAPPPAPAAAPFPVGGAALGAMGAAAGALGGAAVAVPGGAALSGLAAGFAAIAGAPGGDARMQTVTLDTQGVRYVDFRAAAVRLHELPWGD